MHHYKITSAVKIANTAEFIRKVFPAYNQEAITYADKEILISFAQPQTPVAADGVTVEEITYAAPDPNYVEPPRPRILLFPDFIEHVEARAPGAYDRVLTAAQRSPAVMRWVLEAAGRGEVNLDSERTRQGFAALVNAAVLTSVEKTAIFAPQGVQ